MVKSLACRDVGSNCDYVVRGATDDVVIAEMVQHGMDAHKLTAEEVKSPEMLKMVKAAIKNE